MMRALKTFVISGLALCIAATAALAFQSSGRALIVVDHATGLVLAEKNGDVPLPPASMSKIMTVNMAFEALAEGRLSLSDKLPVSTHAAGYGGSTMFLKAGERVSAEDLIRGVIVLSGNDASAVLAEALSPDGTESGFARRMNERALELGLTNSYFKNASGWPDPDHRMSVRDLAKLASHIIDAFPNYYRYFGEREFRFGNRAPENRHNRNPLLKLDFGADGLKTGYTEAAGYGIVGSVVRGKRRVVFVVAGLDSRRIRETEAEKIVNWYYFQFIDRQLFKRGETVANLPVWLGDDSHVTATVPEDISIPLSASESDEIIANAVFDSVVEAPVAKGQLLGRLEVEIPGQSESVTFPLVAAEEVERGGFGVRIATVIASLMQKTGLYELLGL